MIVEQSNSIINEVSRALLGKRDVIEKALMAIYAGGHILLEDVPGTGKTTLALALSRALGLDFKRVQFTPDTLPSDITGFTMFDRDAGVFRFVWGAVNCNMLLGDEINRTSAKTQSALLEVMEERAVTIDGQTHQVMQAQAGQGFQLFTVPADAIRHKALCGWQHGVGLRQRPAGRGDIGLWKRHCPSPFCNSVR